MEVRMLHSTSTCAALRLLHASTIPEGALGRLLYATTFPR